MFYIGRFGGINTQVRVIPCFNSTITNTTGSRGSRQNSVHAGSPPKSIHHCTQARLVKTILCIVPIISKRRIHCRQRSSSSQHAPSQSQSSDKPLPTSINSIDIDRHQPFRHLCRHRPDRGAVPGRHALHIRARAGCL